jgi:hypothetical protein
MLEIMSYQYYAFIPDLGGLDVIHRRCNTHIHIMCFEHVAIPYFGLIRELVWSAIASSSFVRSPAASEKESHRMICLPASDCFTHQKSPCTAEADSIMASI